MSNGVKTASKCIQRDKFCLTEANLLQSFGRGVEEACLKACELASACDIGWRAKLLDRKPHCRNINAMRPSGLTNNQILVIEEPNLGATRIQKVSIYRTKHRVGQCHPSMALKGAD
jgi:hypothetical protein